MGLSGVWGSSGSDAFAAGDDGTIVHYDGKAWSVMWSGVTTLPLTQPWGSSASDVFVVGSRGTILHYDGKGWSPMNSGTEQDLNGIWGTSGMTSTPWGVEARSCTTTAAHGRR